MLSPTRRGMQILLDACELFGNEFGLSYNPDKCESMIFGECPINIRLTLCNKQLKIVPKARHLGHVLNNSRNFLDVSPAITDLKVRTNVILSNFNFLSTESKIKIFNTNCTSFYGLILCILESLDLGELIR